MPSHIYVDNLVFNMSIGDEPEEKMAPQPVCISLKAYADFSAVHQTDSLEDTLDYITLTKVIHNSSQTKHFEMLEYFAFTIISECFLQFPKLTRVVLDVHKPEMNKSLAERIGVAYDYSRVEWTNERS